MNEATNRKREKRARENPCDICRGDAALIHEIARGQHRQKALLANYATLILCSPCHDLKVHQGMSPAQQLAYIHERRFAEFDIEAFYKLTDRRWPDLRDIWDCVKRLRAAADGLGPKGN